jgi:uncharacterized protein YndB with AHSA1/START domain
MTGVPIEKRTLVLERELPHPPEKIWRALTQPHLLEEWLMKTDFKPVLGHRFTFRADWGSVDCKVLALEPNRCLSYTWEAMGLECVLTWTLDPAPAGTRLRMEQSGFLTSQERAYQGAAAGWRTFLSDLEIILGRVD